MINFHPFLQLLVYDGNKERSQKMIDHFHCVAVIKENLEKSPVGILYKVRESYKEGRPLLIVDEEGIEHSTDMNSIDYITEVPEDIMVHIDYYKDKYLESKNKLKKVKKKVKKKTKKKDNKDQPRQLSLF